MLDYDAIIVGGGPAGLAAGLYLSRGKFRTLLIDKDGFGGSVKNATWIENYPGFSTGVTGAQLASEMMTQALKSGLQMEMAEVAEIESYSESRCVKLIEMMQTSLPCIFAVGDIRSNSPAQVVTAVGDGATAAISIQNRHQQQPNRQQC